MKKTYVIMGNGFSIDLIEKIGKTDLIDLKNLFTKGDKVAWPHSKDTGFLSRKHCENLWMLGARTTMSNSEASNFIRDIITCMNVYNLAKNNGKQQIFDEEKNIYIKAYNELCTYLKNLFLYYNNLVSDEELKKNIPNIKLIDYIDDEIKQNHEIIIVTYNYDIFLERMLKISHIPFEIAGFEKKDSKVKIFKPHGSISFGKYGLVKKNRDYTIKSIFDSVTTEISDMGVEYKLETDDSLICAIIPPAGDSNRVATGWTKTLRKELEEAIEKSDEDDSMIIYGLSYDHVDRMELDNIITNINSAIDVKYINPFPSKTLDSVLSSIFTKYIHVKEF